MPRRHVLVSLLSAGALLTACQLGKPTAPGAEGTVALDGKGNAVVKLAGRTLTLHAPGHAVGPIAVLVGGKAYSTDANGGLQLPASALAEAKAKGGFVVLAPGFVPRRVDLADPNGDINLLPATSLGTGQPLPPAGGTVKAGSIAVALAPGLLTKAPTQVVPGLYWPDPSPARLADLAAERDKVLLGRDAGCEKPLPCPPPTEAVGLLLTVDGPLAPGKLDVSYDLAAWLRGWDGQAPEPWVANPAAWSDQDRKLARAAARITKTMAAVEASGDLGLKQLLASTYGISLTGGVLKFAVHLGINAQVEGITRVEVAGFALLGVYLEVTAVSAVTDALPPQVLPPGPTGGLPPGSLLGPGAPVISNNGAGIQGVVRIPIISDAGGQVVSNNGGGFGPGGPGAKRHLLAYTDYLWPSLVTVGLVDQAGAPINPPAPVLVDAASHYALAGLPAGGPAFVQGRAGAYTTYAMAPAAGGTVDHNAATTGLTCLVLDELRSGRQPASAINMAGYAADVAFLQIALSQPQAQFAVSAPVRPVAAMVRGLFGTTMPQTIPITPPPPTGTVLGTFPVGTNPYNVAAAPNGSIWASNYNSSNVTVLSSTGALLYTIPTGAFPSGIGFDAAGNAWIACKGPGTLMKVSPTGTVLGTYPTTLGPTSGSGASAVAFDGSGNMWVANHGSASIAKLGPAGNVLAVYPVTAYPYHLCFDPAGNLWISHANGNAITKLAPTGAVLGTFTVGPNLGFNGIAADPTGNIWVTDYTNLYKLAPSGAVLGTYPTPALSDGVAIDALGNIWLGTAGGTCLKFSPAGVQLGSYPTNGANSQGITIDPSGNIWTSNVGSADVSELSP